MQQHEPSPRRLCQAITWVEIPVGRSDLKLAMKQKQRRPPLRDRKTVDAEYGKRLVAEIDTRLREQRHGEAERATLFVRRRELAQAKPRRGRRVATGKFIAEAAIATRTSRRTIYRDLARADELSVPLLEKIRGTSLDHGNQLDALCKLPPEKRKRLVERAANGEEIEVPAS